MDAFIQTTALRCFDRLCYPPLTIQQGGLTALLGESGSGKSSLLRLFNGTISPQEGSIRYQGQEIAALDSIALRRDLLLASQEVYLFDGTIADNFAAYWAAREQPCPDEAAQRRYLSLCCADFSLDSLCQTLSGGERQRVFLAICLSFLPKLLMLDEPTAALDEATATRFLEQLKAFAREEGMTLLVICHNEALMRRFADHSIRLDGRAEQ